MIGLSDGVADVSSPVIARPAPARKLKRTKEELIKTASPSRISTWTQCRLKFFFRYMSGITKSPTPALFVGTTVHSVLQQWNLARWRREPLDAEAISDVFEKAWSTPKEGDLPVKWNDEESEHKATALAILRMYLRDTPIRFDESPEAVEVTVEMDLASHGLPTLIGVIDLVRQGRKILDFKTVGKTPDAEKVIHTTEIQVTCYGLMYRENTGYEESGIELHHLVKLKSPKLVVTEIPPITNAQITRLFKHLESYVDGISRADFVPSPGLQCSSCEFFNECRSWK